MARRHLDSALALCVRGDIVGVMTVEQTPESWWRTRPEPAVALRALWISVAWSYVASLGALLAVGLAALVSAIVVLVVYLLDFSSKELEIATAWGPAVLVGWIASPIAVAVSIWVAAYGSTQRESVRRATGAVVLASLIGLVLWFTGSLGMVVVVLAVGWTFAIPAEHPGRWVARLVGAIVAFRFYPIWDGVGTEVIVACVLSAPLVAGASVFVGDLVWGGALRMRARSNDETLRAPSSLEL
jgi:cell division protein FtsW (lipid II flippase)